MDPTWKEFERNYQLLKPYQKVYIQLTVKWMVAKKRIKRLLGIHPD
jgi:hypothetical protein